MTAGDAAEVSDKFKIIDRGNDIRYLADNGVSVDFDGVMEVIVKLTEKYKV